MILVDLDRVSMSRPGRALFSDLSLTVASGDRLGLVGINGGGKSTLLSVIAGTRAPEAGVVRRGRGVRIAQLDQEPTLSPGTVRAAVGEGWEAAAALERLGMGPWAGADTATLSGGQVKRAALARTLCAETDLLILDEPTNHLDIEGIAWLEDRLAAFTGGLVLVTHDRRLLDRVTTRILELDRGRGHLHEGGYAAYLEASAEREDRAAQAESVRRNLARRELAWLRRGAPARTRKPQARIDAALTVVQGRREAPARAGVLDLEALHGQTPRLGDQVIELHGVGHGFGEGPDLFAGLDLALDPRERLGVVGANGAGKTTLLDILAGRITPRRGRVVRGVTAEVGCYRQRATDTLDPALRVRDVVAGPHRSPDYTDAALMERFWFDADAQWAPVELLSGGERRRLQLLAVLAARPNVLLLDEPTNDLDVDSLRALEDFLDDWPGALVVVSHDRAFLERTVTDALLLDGAGFAGRWPGGYAAWDAERVRPSAGRAAGAGPNGRADPARARPDRSAGRGRSASTLRHQLRDAEREMERLAARRDALAEELAQAVAHEELARLGRALAELDAALRAAEERWLAAAEAAESSPA